MREYTPNTETVREQYTREQPPHVGTVSSKCAEFDRWLDRERAAARREGQVEALRAAANTDDPDHYIEVALGGGDYVRDWLNARADRIENGADR